MDKHKTRKLILEQALKLAPFEGWTSTMLAQATDHAHLHHSDLVRVFDSNPLEVIEFWTEQVDLAMAEYTNSLAMDEMKIRERIYKLIMFRLELLHPHREAVRRATRLIMMPWNAGLNLKLLSNTVDTMWKLAGDTSHDYNWYSKRILLAGVYSSTLLYWFSDESADMGDTAKFLEYRIEDVLKLGGTFSKLIKRVA